MRQFNIGDYSIFNEADTVIKNSLQNLKGNLNKANSEMTKLKSQDVFEGPISDSVNEGWQSIEESASNNIFILSSAAITLTKISALYQNSDNYNAGNIGSV